MRKKISNLALAVLIIISVSIYSSFGQTITKDTSVRTGKLSNGLTYYIRHNQIPKGQADFHLVQKVGSVLEDENQHGLAHFLEHMAFNGTKHFPGNSMVPALEKKGIKFGINVNAYTAYDETVYRLTNIPISREGILDTALLVLHDWSGFILNNDKDIDEERGVIREEWRTRSSGLLRVQERQILPELFSGTPYANRLPIGTLNVINNFKPQELRDYYTKWYRPDLQGIVIVGDVDVNKVEAKLKKLFADVPRPVTPAQRKYYHIPDNEEPIIAIATDPEIRNTSAMVYWKQDTISPIQKTNPSFFKMAIVNNIISNMMNERFADMVKKNKITYRATLMPDQYSVSSRPVWALSIDAPDNNLPEALESSLLECERMRRFGFSKNEFEPGIKSFNLINNESNYYDRNTIENFQYSREYVNQFLSGGISPTPEWEYRMTREILNGLTLDTLNFYAKRYIQDRNMAFAIVYPATDSIQIPSKTDIIKVWEEVKKTALKPWVKEDKPNDLANLKVPVAGRVIKTEENTKPYGFIKWELSNGVNVWFKKTGYEESGLLVYGYKPGGYSLRSIDDLPSTMAYNNAIASNPGFEGNYGKADVTSKLDRNFATISGKGSILHTKVLFQNLYLRMTKFKKDKKAFYSWKAAQEEGNKSRSSVPKMVYGDTLVSIMSNRHPRALSLNDPRVLDKVNYKKIIKLHQDFFGNAHGFTFIMSGNVNEDSVKALAETWLGGLPSFKKEERIIDHGIYPPTGIVKKQFTRKMETPQSTIIIGYTGEIPFTIENSLLMNFSSEILKKVYYETIREQEGGSYGVGVNAELIKHPTERFLFQVNFDTDPDPIKKQKLIGIVYREITKLMELGPDQEKLDKIKLNALKDYRQEISKQNASYWNGMQGGLLFYGVDQVTNYDKIIASITPKMIQDFARKLFKQGNIIEVVMDPANSQAAGTQKP